MKLPEMSKLRESEFKLSSDELEQIKYSSILKRRKGKDEKKKFSDFLSPEAQIAMQLAVEDTKELAPTIEEIDQTKTKGKTSVYNASSADQSKSSDARAQPNRQKMGPKKRSFADIYDANSVGRMEGDITDEKFDASSLRKRALDGGKVESAMEIVETVFRDGIEPECDDIAIEEIAKQNAVDKCLVWMVATDDIEGEKETKGEAMEVTGDS